MSEATKGPWAADIGETAVVRDPAGNQLMICTHIRTREGGRREAGEVAANCRVAAAAPAMRDALVNVLALARIKWGNLDPDANAILQQAAAALALTTAGVKTDE